MSAPFAKHLRRARLRAALSLPTFALVAGSAWAASPPNAGTLLNNVGPAPEQPLRSTEALPEAPPRPALKLDTLTKITVKHIHITGIKAYPESTLLPLVSDAIGEDLTLAQLDELAQRITRYYRDHGHLLARAYLPAQEIKDGEVEIAVLEGRVGKLTIEDTSRLSQARVAARLSAIKEGEALSGPDLERSLLLLSDVPGVRVTSTLSPGASVGTTDLDVRVAATSPLSGSIGVDNYGNRFTGQPRLNGSAVLADPLHIGDFLGVDAVISSGLDYGRAAYQLPINSVGTQLGAAFSAMHYRLGRDFSSLDAHGTAYVSSLYLLHPLIRSRLFNLNAQLDFDHKALTDDIGATATSSHKVANVLTLGLSGDRLDHVLGGGFTSWSAAFSAGDLAPDALTRALDAAGHDTSGSYHKFNFALARVQSLPGKFSLYAALRAQHALGNLDSSEKMVLGGAAAVRAYPDGEAPSDDAWLGTVELRYAFSARWQASAFFDAAQGYLNHQPIALDTNNKRRLSGAGIGLVYSLPHNLLIRASVAWRTGPQPTSDSDRSPRAWLQAVKYF
ncbi:hemolysin activation/secretion protein [Trinickia symbiotica]|nr:hemolysin activation/secretion protein [Trinickia symbiotica]